MTLRLYYRPFSSFCQKAATALYERGVAFEAEIVDLGDSDHRASVEALWPTAKFPVLRDEAAGETVAEASLIVEYADRFGEATALVPADRDAALGVRRWDRVFDLYVNVPLQKAVGAPLITSACWRGRASPVPSTRRGLTADCSRSNGRRIISSAGTAGAPRPTPPRRCVSARRGRPERRPDRRPIRAARGRR